jgi:short-subunit dehydrogenase
MFKKKSTSKRNETVFITGGSRGLGLVFATLYAKRGARVAICSRTYEDLERAERRIQMVAPGAEVHCYLCDVSKRDQVDETIDAIYREVGPIDILVNNAGVILSSPFEHVDVGDFKDSMNSNLWGMLNTSLSVLPHMVERKQGKILNITSVGGVIPVPHLLAYSTAKFGAVGFSTTAALSLRRAGVSVTTAIPGLMRTGSFLHAKFKGEHRAEMSWFSLLSTLPGITLSAERAAKLMIRACDRGQAFAVIGWPAKLARLGFALFPNLMIHLMSGMERLLPHLRGRSAAIADAMPGLRLSTSSETKEGATIQTESGVRPQTELGNRAARRWNEVASDR